MVELAQDPLNFKSNRKSYYHEAEKAEFKELPSLRDLIVEAVSDDLGIEACRFAIAVGMDLYKEFKPTEEFLKLYLTSQLVELVKQTGWKKPLDAVMPSVQPGRTALWEKYSKSQLIKAILGLKADDVAKCELPDEIMVAFGLKKDAKTARRIKAEAERGNDGDPEVDEDGEDED